MRSSGQASILTCEFQAEVMRPPLLHRGGNPEDAPVDEVHALRCRGGASVRQSHSLGETECFALLRALRWPQGVVCPRGNHTRVTTHSKMASTARRRYLCLECRRTFTDLTGTAFARTNLSLATWLRCLRLMGQGLRTSELARALGVKWETTERMQRRLAPALTRPGLIRDLRDAVIVEAPDD